METYKLIGELAKEVDINPSAIRYYESIGMLPKPKRINGQRRYNIQVLDQLKFIKTAQLAGFSNQEIITLLEGFDEQDSPSDRWRQMALKKRSELEVKKIQIDTMMTILNNGLDCKCLTWSECFSKVNPDGTCNS